MKCCTMLKRQKYFVSRVNGNLKHELGHQILTIYLIKMPLNKSLTTRLVNNRRGVAIKKNKQRKLMQLTNM